MTLLPAFRTAVRLAAALAVCQALAAPAVGAAATAEDFPARPVRMIVGFPAGGGTDIVARIFAEKLSSIWEKQVIVENKAGAGGVIGTDAAARSQPDGYTLFMGTLGNFSVNQHLYKMDIDPVKAFAPVSQAVDVDFVLVAHPSLPAGTVAELVELAKRKPGEITYSSSGVGGAPHLAGALFNETAGVELRHIPYKGSGPSFTDLIGGHVSVTFDSLVQALPHIEAGQLRPLAVLGARRSPLLPDVPTMQEAGMAGYDFSNWFGIAVPADTPDEVVRKLNQDIGKAQADPQMKGRLEKMGAGVAIGPPEKFGALMKAESDKWRRIIQETGIKAN